LLDCADAHFLVLKTPIVSSKMLCLLYEEHQKTHEALLFIQVWDKPTQVHPSTAVGITISPLLSAADISFVTLQFHS